MTSKRVGNMEFDLVDDRNGPDSLLKPQVPVIGMCICSSALCKAVADKLIEDVSFE